MHYIPPGVKMITPDHSLTFTNLASANFTLLSHNIPKSPDVRMIQELGDGTVLDKNATQVMSWTKGCYFGKSGVDDVMLCWQEMEALQRFCIGIESPERGFFKPIRSHYKTKYFDGSTDAGWTFPAEDPSVGYTFPNTMNYHIVVTSHSLKDQLELRITVEDKTAVPKGDE